MNATVEQFRGGTITTSAELANPMITLTIGQIFFDDHENRALVTLSGERDQYLIRSTKTTFILRLSLLDWAEVMSDADYYDDQREAYGSDYKNLCASARSCWKSVRKQLVFYGFMYDTETVTQFVRRINGRPELLGSR